MSKRILCIFLSICIFTTSFSFLNVTEVKATGVIEGAAAWALEDAIFSALMTLAFYCGVDGSSAFDYDEDNWYNPDTSSIEDLTEYRNKNKRAFKVILGGGGKLPNDDFDLKETLSVTGALDAFLHTLDSDRDSDEIALVNQLKERISNDPNYLDALYEDFGESAVNGYLNIDKAFVDMNIYNSSVQILSGDALVSDLDKVLFDNYRSLSGYRFLMRYDYYSNHYYYFGSSNVLLSKTQIAIYGGDKEYKILPSNISTVHAVHPIYGTSNISEKNVDLSLRSYLSSSNFIFMSSYGQPDSIVNGRPLTSNIIDVKELLTNDEDGKLQIKPDLDNDPEAVPKVPQVVNYQTINNYNKQILQGEKTFPDTVPDVVKQTSSVPQPQPQPDSDFEFHAPKDLKDFFSGTLLLIPDFIKVIVECFIFVFNLPIFLSGLFGGGS